MLRPAKAPHRPTPLYGFRPAVVLLLAVQAGCTRADPSAVVFDRTRLHTVAITVDAAYLESLATDIENRVPCTVSYDGRIIDDAAIRQKGNKVVELSDKPSFSIKLASPLDGVTKLILDNNSKDPTLLHEMLGADVFTRAEMLVARVAHAKVTLNGSDSGIYAVVEGVDKAFVRRTLGAKNDDGNLYEGPCCGDFVDDIAHMQLDDEQKDGRSRDDLQALADVIRTATDEELASAVDKRLDLDQFITSYALEAVLDHWDGYAFGANNYYFYDNPADGRFVFIPHGMDRILEDPRFDPEMTPVARLPQRIRSIPSLDATFRAKLSQVVASAWNEAEVMVSIDQAARVFHSAGSGARTSLDVAAFDGSVAAFRDSLRLRRDLLDPSIQCGDLKVEGLETCDDGNTVSGDGCSAACRVEP